MVIDDRVGVQTRNKIIQIDFWFQDIFSLSVSSLSLMRTQNTSFCFYNWLLENEGHVENEGVIWKYFQKESVQTLGVLRTHRHIMTFPEVISTRKTEQLLEECEGYHAKHVYVVQVRGNDGRSQSSGGTSSSEYPDFHYPCSKPH